MTPFERTLNILFGRMSIYENDPGFGYRIYRLQNEDQARIYRLPRQVAKAANDTPPPQKGLFVAIATNPATGQPCMAYCEYPKGGGESIRHAALNYDPREITKGSQHIAEFLARGKIPQADGEFAKTE